MTTQTRLEKAYLALIAPPNPPSNPPNLARVAGQRVSGGEGEILFTFNPEKFSVSKGASWQRASQAGAPSAAMPEFTGSNPSRLTVQVFLDATDAASPTVMADVQRLLDCVVPLQRTIASGKPSPPWVVFGWGTYVSVVSIVTEVKADYTMFRPDGTPIRASVDLTLEEVPVTQPRQNPTSGGLDTQRSHQVVAGDTLASVAQAEYGSAGRWRSLAAANGIDDPMRVAPGTRLLVPELDAPVGAPGAGAR